MRSLAFIVVIVLMVAACQPAPDDSQLPTLAVLPSLEAVEGTVESTAETTEAVGTETPMSTSTSRPTNTPTQPTATRTPVPSPTFDPTLAVNLTATAAVEEAPVLATLTPRPQQAAVVATDVPQVLADVVITERQFQEEINRQIAGSASIQSADIDFVPEGINVDLTAQGGQAFITGEVLISVVLTGTFATITIGDIRVNAPEVPEAYVEVVQTDFFFKVIDALDAILTERLGEDQNLESIVMTDREMQIELLVPES
jgi:hypothetical protein